MQNLNKNFLAWLQDFKKKKIKKIKKILDQVIFFISFDFFFMKI